MSTHHQSFAGAAPIFCTVVTAPHLGQARALAASLQKHHPRAQLFVLLADRVEAGTLDQWKRKYSGENLTFIALDQLPEKPEVVERMCFYYTPFELCCALRGLLHKYLWQNTNAPQWIFLDADIWITHSLDALFAQLEAATLLLTPHRQKAPALQHASTLENSLLCSGLYNAGFLGVLRCEESNRFINWFASRLERYSLDDLRGRGWFVDQLWLNLAPHYFEGIQFVTSRGANAGHWNLFDARFEYSSQDNCFHIDGDKLLFFHFSGWNAEKPAELSAHVRDAEKLPPENEAAWQKLSEMYNEAIMKFTRAEYSAHPYAFGHFDDGHVISRWMRRHYWELCDRNEVPFDCSPFSQSEYFHRAENAVRPTLRNRIVHHLRSIKG